MNAIVEEAIVSCYIDSASLLVMIILLLLSDRLRRMDSAPIRIFHQMSLCVSAKCVTSFICNAMYMQPEPWCNTVALAGRTVGEILLLQAVYLWLSYVQYRLYGKVKKRYEFILVKAPLILIFVLLVVNLFTGILFTYSEMNEEVFRPLMYVIYAFEFLSFCSSALIIRYFDRKSTKIRLLRVSPMIISVIMASGTQYISHYDIGILGFVIGLTLLYFSMTGELRFVDEESGLYNKRYVSYLLELASMEKNDVRCAMILDTDGDIQSGFRILHSVLHQNGDVIRVDRNKFLMFTPETSLSTIEYLSSLVEEAVSEHNAAHPDQKVQITARARMRTPEEDAFSFLRAVMDEKDVGLEMKGIASMISELDRLDKELTLAADIQVSMLPSNFPPFPDRKEFDLYASMTPAKEVGGDFYDFFLIDSDHLALVIADVSGKGIPAALFMMMSKTLIKNQLMSGYDPATALQHVNAQLYEHNTSMMFVTVWVAVVQISTGRGMACNAGHENPGLRRAGGRFELLSYRHSILVGVSKKAEYELREFELSPGDCLFVYTDGVPEATNGSNVMFGDKRLTDTLNEHPDADPETLIRGVHAAVDDFVEGVPQFDDITMLCLKYYGPQGNKGEE